MSALTALERVKQHHKIAFECISEALQIDEDPNGPKKEAVKWYLKGIEKLERGLEEECPGATREDKEKARKIQAKMKTNLVMAKERLEHLLLSDDEDSELAGSNPTKTNQNGADAKKYKSTSKNTTHAKPRHPPGSLIPKYTVMKKSVTVEKRKPWIHSAARPSSGSQERPSSSDDKRPNSRGSIRSDNNAKFAVHALRDKTFKNVPKEMINKILDDLVEPGSHSITMDDVAGQEVAKQALREIVILPALRPDFFTGLRTPARGLLLFGPPGTGKTLLAKAVAAEAKSNFFNISASTLTSKWVGEGEKMVRALFAVARDAQPSVVFIDEIDSLLCERKEGESDSVRRLKTEFMMRFDGVDSNSGDRILVMGATNRPHELDDAVLRRFPKRVYVSLPDVNARFTLLSMLLKKQNSPLKKEEVMRLAQQTEFYSGSDLTELAKDSALGPVREMSQDQIVSIDIRQMRPIKYTDFAQSLKKIRPSVSVKMLKVYEEWNAKFGDNSAL